MEYFESYKDLCHGTTEEAAENIKRAGFEPSCAKGNWCGAGVYFYDIKAKAYWAANRKCEEIKKQTGKKLVIGNFRQRPQPLYEHAIEFA